MLLQIKKYDIVQKYNPGEQVILADTLLRAFSCAVLGYNYSNFVY